LDNWDRSDLSQALLLAQQKLNTLREHFRDQEPLPNPKPDNDGRTKPPPPFSFKQQQQLPDHLGWGSVPLTNAFRKAQRQQQRALRNNIKLYPDLALGMLGQKAVAAGRIWLLLQHIDRSGRGWLTLATAREQLTKENTALHICGRRQLRKLLARGEGLFWTRDAARIWLRSPVKVAAALGITHLSGRPVALPISILLEGLGSIRAHFYASFHSGRLKEHGGSPGKLRGVPQAAPLSRATLQALSHVKPRTQRHYERRAKVQRQPNFVVSRQSNKDDIQEQAWRRGRAWFRFTDHAGKLGLFGLAITK